jgi:transposase
LVPTIIWWTPNYPKHRPVVQNGPRELLTYWGRELAKLGHTVRLIAPQFVRPYVRSNKTDAADAEAICEAVQRPHMRFVPVKTQAQQTILSLHRARVTDRRKGAGDDRRNGAS